MPDHILFMREILLLEWLLQRIHSATYIQVDTIYIIRKAVHSVTMIKQEYFRLTIQTFRA